MVFARAPVGAGPRDGSELHRAAWAIGVVLVAIGLLRGEPSLCRLEGVVAAIAASCLALSLASRRSAVRTALGALTGLSLATLSVFATSWWATAAGLVVVTVSLAGTVFPALSPPAGGRAALLLPLGLGVVFPAVMLGALATLGGDLTRQGLALSFVPVSVRFVASALVVLVLTLVALDIAVRAATEGVAPPPAVLLPRGAVIACVGVFLARMAWVASVATIPTDMMGWSEDPFLTNILKLRAGVALYGPLEDADSYNYSPGTEFLNYALLRPLGLELVLLAHRALTALWQATATGVLAWALSSSLGAVFRPVLGRWTPVLVVSTLGSAIFATVIAPHVHPDHLLKVCFALALAGAIALPRLRERWIIAGLVLLPPAAVVCKLTGAGIGVGLGLVVLAERKPRWLVPLGVAAVAALGTFPLFDATLGHATTWILRVESRHQWEWHRAWAMLGGAEGRAFLVALLALALLRRKKPCSELVRAATRVLLLTAGFMSIAALSFLKRGGLEHNLFPLTVGAVVAILLLVAEAHARWGRADVVTLLAATLSLWITLGVSPARAPLVGPPRERVLAWHARTQRWLEDEVRAGRRPLLYLGVAAWIGAGLRDPPRDHLGPASELYLGHWPQVNAHIRRLFDGTYDGILLTGAALRHNELVISLRARLEEHYDVVEPIPGVWPPEGPEGILILKRRNVEASRGSGPF